VKNPYVVPAFRQTLTVRLKPDTTYAERTEFAEEMMLGELFGKTCP
jgi:hypothetical protein